jgi:hypothetical protein
MAKAKGGATTTSNKGSKVVFSNNKGKTSIGGSHNSIKFSTMNKSKRASYKPYRGQGRGK